MWIALAAMDLLAVSAYYIGHRIDRASKRREWWR
jgi:hypothetical protein